MTGETNRSVERALHVLDAVCDIPGQTLSAIAETVGLPPSSTLRILRTLEGTGHVSRTPEGRYISGPQLLWLGGRVLGSSSLRRVCRDGMHALAEETGESVFLSVRHGERALYIDVVPGDHLVQLGRWEGQEIPLSRSAAGRCLTGDMRDEEAVVVVSGVEDDITAIAVPILLGKEPIAALSIVLPSYRVTPERRERLADLLIARARSMSIELGSVPADRAPTRLRPRGR